MDYISINKISWNKRVGVHLDSEMYDVPAFLNGKSSLKQIELDLLGNIEGKSLLHLQCHFGQDTLSLERLGANCTGLDFSDEAIKTAEEHRDTLGLNTKFVCTDVYNTRNEISDQFDIVYTSYGTIGWLPDLDKWAKVIYDSLKPSGRFVFAEFHPIMWMYDDDFDKVTYNYDGGEPLIEDIEGTYAGESEDKFATVFWNHGMSTVVNALLKAGLELKDFKEYNYSPYNCVAHMEKIGEDKYHITKFGDKVPLVYSLVLTKQ